MSKRQITDEPVQRAVQHGVLGLHLSTKNLLQILVQSALSIMGAIENTLLISDITLYLSCPSGRLPLRTSGLLISLIVQTFCFAGSNSKSQIACAESIGNNFLTASTCDGWPE